MMFSKAPKHNRIRSGRHVNKPHLAYVAEQPCCVCNEAPCQAHHPITGDARRQYGKSHDFEAVPLCFARHQELHDKIGNESKFQEIYSVTFHEVARLLAESSEFL